MLYLYDKLTNLTLNHQDFNINFLKLTADCKKKKALMFDTRMICRNLNQLILNLWSNTCVEYRNVTNLIYFIVNLKPVNKFRVT